MNGKMNYVDIICILVVSLVTFSETLATEYEGKIKSIYLHDRDTDPYFGIVLEGEMTENPCGSRKDVFIAVPDEVNEVHYAMLLAAKTSGQTVKISNNNATQGKVCFGPYSKFNFVQIL